MSTKYSIQTFILETQKLVLFAKTCRNITKRNFVAKILWRKIWFRFRACGGCSSPSWRRPCHPWSPTPPAPSSPPPTGGAVYPHLQTFFYIAKKWKKKKKNIEIHFEGKNIYIFMFITGSLGSFTFIEEKNSWSCWSSLIFLTFARELLNLIQ